MTKSKAKPKQNLSVFEQGQDKAEYIINLDGERVGSYSLSMFNDKSPFEIRAELEIRLSLNWTYREDAIRNDITFQQNFKLKSKSYSLAKGEVSDYVMNFARFILDNNEVVKDDD